MATPPDRLSIRYLCDVPLFWWRKPIVERTVMSWKGGNSVAPNAKPRTKAALLAAQRPIFIEEPGGDDLSRIAVVGRRGGVDDRVIGNLGDLPRVVQVIVLAEGEAAVEHDVLFRIQRIRINENRRVLIGGEFLGPDRDRFGAPLRRQFVRDLREHRVAARIAPQHEVAVR